MGISGLLQFLRERGCTQPFESFQKAAIRSVAIDVPIFVHKFIYQERCFEGLQRRFLKFADQLKDQNVQPIFVFDGLALPMKERERQLRQVSRDKQIAKHRFEPPKALLHTTSIEELDGYVITNDNVGPCMNVSQEPVFQGLLFPTSHEYAQLKTILEEHGHTIQTAKYEAEALCAYLCSRGVVDAVLTEDSDAIAFGAPKTIFRFYQKDAFLVNFDDVLKTLGLSKSSFQDMCMLFGCDFCEKVYKIGPKGAFDLVKQHHSWPEAYGHFKFVWIGKTSQTAKEFHACWPEVKGCFESFAYEHSQDQAMS